MAEAETHASQPHDAVAGIYTETLARLYLKQGFAERALAIYRRLAQEQPGNDQLQERLRTMEQALTCGRDGSAPAAPRAVHGGAGESATPVRCRQEHQIVAQLEQWLRYLQRRRSHCERP
jgi:hypothetical protein